MRCRLQQKHNKNTQKGEVNGLMREDFMEHLRPGQSKEVRRDFIWEAMRQSDAEESEVPLEGTLEASGLCQSMGKQFSSVTQSCPTLCNPTDCSTPGFPVHCQLPELAQAGVH